MKIKIELEYPIEQIEFFAQSRNKPTEENINDFVGRFLTTLIAENIVVPFIDKIQQERRMEEVVIRDEMLKNAIGGISLTVV